MPARAGVADYAMGTWNAFYIRAEEETETAIKAVRLEFPDAAIERGEKFIGIRMPSDTIEVPEKVLKDLSSQLGAEIIWMSFQSNVDAFGFHHWRAGAHVRSLVFGYAEERTWERIEGQPEP